MEISGFNENDISEQNKMTLQSETWKEVRQKMKEEVPHFTEAPEIQHFAIEKVRENDNVYGVVWGNMVREYLKTAYSEKHARADVVSDGITYKVLRREKVTAFYDADGNTLFDVENKRLEKEYGYVMQEDKVTATSEEEIDNAAEAEEKHADLEKKEANKEAGEAQEEEQSGNDGVDVDNNMIPMGSASLKEIVMGLPAPTEEEIAVAKEENARSVKQRAKEKLEKELNEAKDKNFAEPIIGYLLKRCEEDEGVAEDVVQVHKTWDKCFDYIYEQARKQATGNRAAVRDDVVYEWAEDYYHKDDKAEEAEKARKVAEAKAKREKAAAKSKPAKTAAKTSADRNKAKVPVKEEKPKEQPKPKKSGKDMEGQLDMFSMLGM